MHQGIQEMTCQKRMHKEQQKGWDGLRNINFGIVLRQESERFPVEFTETHIMDTTFHKGLFGSE